MDDTAAFAISPSITLERGNVPEMGSKRRSVIGRTMSKLRFRTFGIAYSGYLPAVIRHGQGAAPTCAAQPAMHNGTR
tara:strand:- start:1076 stop:1306 length:231 start_codon:yes stop_codon:yes gene_type:complete